jgi:hypothetical protein
LVLGPSGIFTAGTIVCAASAGTLADILLGGATPDLHALLERDSRLCRVGSRRCSGRSFGERGMVWSEEWLSTIARTSLFDAAAGGARAIPSITLTTRISSPPKAPTEKPPAGL